MNSDLAFCVVIDDEGIKMMEGESTDSYEFAEMAGFKNSNSASVSFNLAKKKIMGKHLVRQCFAESSMMDPPAADVYAEAPAPEYRRSRREWFW